MYLSRIVLEKNNQRVILQGMIHLASSETYRIIQEDMDDRVKEGYRIFLEGVRDVPSNLNSYTSDRERRIAKFLKFIFELSDIVYSIEGSEAQGEFIEYPEDVVDADVSFKDLLNLLVKERFRYILVVLPFKRILDILEEKLDDEKFIKEVGKDLLEDLNSSEKIKRSLPGLILGFLFSFLLQWIIAKPIMVGYRNKRVVNLIERYISSENYKRILVHYGEGHISGIKRLLKKKGWKLIDSSRLELSF